MRPSRVRPPGKMDARLSLTWRGAWSVERGAWSVGRGAWSVGRKAWGVRAEGAIHDSRVSESGWPLFVLCPVEPGHSGWAATGSTEGATHFVAPTSVCTRSTFTGTGRAFGSQK